jgi:hypothetical protein
MTRGERRGVMRALLLVVGLGAACRCAVAQPEVLGTWLWKVTTQDGDAIVEPGETATFTLSMDFSPNVGEAGLTGGEIFGLGLLKFDTLGMAGAEMGQVVGWEILNDLDIDLGDVTTTDGTSLFGTTATQFFLFGPFVHDDPIDVIAVEWAPSTFQDFSVTYETSTDEFLVWEGPIDQPQTPEWPVVDTVISFQVVPSPSGVLTVLPVVAAWGGRRARPWRRTAAVPAGVAS